MQLQLGMKILIIDNNKYNELTGLHGMVFEVSDIKIYAYFE